MKHSFILSLLACGIAFSANAKTATVSSPDGKTVVTVSDTGGKLFYTVDYDGKQILLPSPLGLQTNVGDFSKDLKFTGDTVISVADRYSIRKIKNSDVNYNANRLVCDLTNADGNKMSVAFEVSDNNVAFRYELPHQKERGSVRVMKENTGFSFPEKTTTFLSPQSDAMIGWKRTKPSYEEEYTVDAPMDKKSQYGHGYTFPALFRIGDDGWALLSETDVDSRYCGSRLSDFNNGTYTIEFPMPEENNGNGTSEPAFALPGHTPWRTVTVGGSLNPIVETTVMWDVVRPRYEASKDYEFGKGTWSWIVWQDNSMNWDDQIVFIDLAADLGWDHILIDAGWDKAIGEPRMEELIDYAREKGIDVYLWYSSSGYWNDIVQSPTNRMDNSIIRKKEMDWLQKNKVKGIKVDFFGGDKQETIRLYEEILSDANDHGLEVIFHGCTLPRGWERMYPNYVGSEAVLASENIVFNQHFCDNEAFNASLHPFIRNASGSMEFGGTFLNKRLNRGNNGGTTRVTTDDFQLATAVLFQNPVQNFALTPTNLSESPAYTIDFMKNVPTVWDETRLIEGYPGKYVVLARRNGNRWYIAAVNATGEPVTIKSELPILAGKDATVIASGKAAPMKKNKKGKINITMQPNDGFVIVTE